MRERENLYQKHPIRGGASDSLFGRRESCSRPKWDGLLGAKEPGPKPLQPIEWGADSCYNDRVQ